MLVHVALAGLAVAGLNRRRAMCWSVHHRFECASVFTATIGAQCAPIVAVKTLIPGRVTVLMNHGTSFASVARSAVAWFENRAPSVYAKIVLTSSEFYPSAECLVQTWFGLPYSTVDRRPSIVAALEPGVRAVIFIHDKEGLVTSQMRYELNEMCRSASYNNCELSFVIVEAA